MSNLKILHNQLIAFKSKMSHSSSINQAILHRAEYAIIKSRQLLIVDNRINKNMNKLYCFFHKKRKIQENEYQDLLSELLLDAENFFYIASRLIDLLSKGMQEINLLSKTKKNKKFGRIMTIRNELLEHSQKPGKPIENEICAFGYNKKYGPYLRASKNADDKKPCRDRAYYPLRNKFSKDLIEILSLYKTPN